MKIKRLSYYDDELKWKLNSVDFNKSLNLLVGISGVGKTRTLRSIHALKSIANGSSYNGVEWEVQFTGEDSLEYLWSGKFETLEENTALESPEIDEDLERKNEARILSECLMCQDTVVVERSGDEIVFNGSKTPKLSNTESAVKIFENEDDIVPVRSAFRKIIEVGRRPSQDSELRLTTSALKRYEKSSLDDLKNSSLSVAAKLAILYKSFPKEFDKIKASFTDIFPNVVDIKIEKIQKKNIPVSIAQILQDATTLSIRERGVEPWIDNISAGMRKTIVCISELFFAPSGSIVMIDELENSLGINCIDSVADLILSNKDSQFIVTSHHPYIVNNITPAFWKIVTRKGGEVTVKKPEDFHISSSRQEAFIELINVLEDEEVWSE
ncbi:MAG: ATP-binding protein [Oscillatoriales cyanobacterium]|nr:MAG: ATP-binding protein [Oscillatoriales cyanobacterium]